LHPDFSRATGGYDSEPAQEFKSQEIYQINHINELFSAVRTSDLTLFTFGANFLHNKRILSLFLVMRGGSGGKTVYS